MILKTFALKFFKYLIRRRFVLRYNIFFKKKFYLKSEALRMRFFEKDLIKSFKEIIDINFPFSNFDR